MLFSWRLFFKRAVLHWRALLVVFALEFIVFSPSTVLIFIDFWSHLLLTPTLILSSALSHIFGLDYAYKILPGSDPIFGTAQFEVVVGTSCAGYEGMTLIIILLTFYIYIQHENLKIARSMMLIPIAAFMMFLLNGLRIFVLVAIGHYWSPEVAINGFHTVGGWLNLLVVFILSLLLMNYMPFFHKDFVKTKTSFNWGDTALLLPLMSLIATSLLTKSISPDFAWLYPVHILVAAFVIYVFRVPFLAFLRKPSTTSVLIGVAVFALWIYLIPEDTELSGSTVKSVSV